MAKYILKRIGLSIVTLLVLTTIVFVLVRLMPGDPFSSDKMTPEIRANMEAYYGLDKSLPEQYITYMNNLLHGDLGYSMKYVNQSVNRIIAGCVSVFGRPGNPCADICRDFRRDSWCSRIVEPREKAGCGLYHYCNHRNIDPGLYHGVFAAVFLRDPMGAFAGRSIYQCGAYDSPVDRGGILHAGDGIAADARQYAGGSHFRLYKDSQGQRSFKMEDHDQTSDPQRDHAGSHCFRSSGGVGSDRYLCY